MMSPVQEQGGGFRLTSDQSQAIRAFQTFLAGDTPIFILRGSAGTGKTTLIKEFIRIAGERDLNVTCLAPTGRAASVLQQRTAHSASTIHSAIYNLERAEYVDADNSEKESSVRLVFRLKESGGGRSIYIVDESSMVGDKESHQESLQFGSGKLLSDLIEHLRCGEANEAGHRPKLVFVGDPAQLPPIGESASPALDQERFQREHTLETESFDLREVVRHSKKSAILNAATRLRDAIEQLTFDTFDLAPCNGEIIALPSSPNAIAIRLAEAHRGGRAMALIAYKNMSVRDWNAQTREALWGDSDKQPRVGDRLLVNRNSPGNSLFNGDFVTVHAMRPMAEVVKVQLKGRAEPISLRFREVTLRSLAVGGSEVLRECLILENLLDSASSQLDPAESQALLVDLVQRNPGVRARSHEMEMLMPRDRYFNAVHVRYGYALTGHKAQGGEWDEVIVDFADQRGQTNKDWFQWTYTAITRARRVLCTICAPSFGACSPRLDAAAGAQVNDPHEPSEELLIPHHRRLRLALEQVGIQIVSRESHAYQQCYVVIRDGKFGALKYWYKGNGKVSKVEWACSNKIMKEVGSAWNEPLSLEAIKIAGRALLGDNRGTR